MVRKRQRTGMQGLVWLAMLGLWMLILLRSFMIAYVTVSSFNIGTYVAYLAPVHPLMLVCAVVGTARLWRLLQGRRVAHALPAVIACIRIWQAQGAAAAARR